MDAQRHGAVILVDHAHLCVPDFAAEGVAEHDQLDERKHHRHQHQRRRAQKLAQFAFDNGKHPFMDASLACPAS